MAKSKYKRLRQILLIALLTPLIGVAIYLAFSVYNDSEKRATMLNDYSTLNSMKFGILSVNAWKEDVKDIIKYQVENFELTPEQDSILHLQLTQLLQNLIMQADSAVDADSKGLKGTLRNWAFDIFINKDKLKSKAPEFSRAIMDEMLKEKNMDRLKTLALDKVEEYASQTYQEQDSVVIKELYSRYDMSVGDPIEDYLKENAAKLEEKNYQETFVIVGIVILFLLLWLIVFRYPDLRKPMFFLSVALALTVLGVGLSSAMIEIDARVDKVEFVLLGEEIHFDEQVVFYRSKSIIELVIILLETGKADSILVGILVLSFSVILPISKLISTEIYLMGKEKWRKNKLLSWLALKSGKWSMADVMVVAIFMAYVGFSGILDSQLQDLNVQKESFASIATNQTSLQPGYILFISFVIFGLILSVILKMITNREERRRKKIEQ